MPRKKERNKTTITTGCYEKTNIKKEKKKAREKNQSSKISLNYKRDVVEI